MKKAIFVALMLQLMCVSAWAADLDPNKYYAYCSCGNPAANNGIVVNSHLKNDTTNSVYVITPAGFSSRAEADKYVQSLKGRCPAK